MENLSINKKPVELFFACDDNYIPCFAVVMQSIMEHADMYRAYNIRVLHSGNICKENQERILDKYNKFNIHIEFVDITDCLTEMSNRLHTRDYYSKSTYYRLFIPSMYPELDKALYVDCDIALLDDVAKLFDIELSENYVGAIPDESVQITPAFQKYVENRIGVKSYKEYFNAGVLLMNLRKLREINFENLFWALLGRVTFTVAQDQDYLNTICNGHVHFISQGWNKMPLRKNVPDEDISLIHYNLSFKPWHLDNVLYEEYFWEYANKCPYKDDIYNIKKNYNVVMQEKSNKETENLIKQTEVEANDLVENMRIKEIVAELKKEFIPEDDKCRIIYTAPTSKKWDRA